MNFYNNKKYMCKFIDKIKYIKHLVLNSIHIEYQKRTHKLILEINRHLINILDTFNLRSTCGVSRIGPRYANSIANYIKQILLAKLSDNKLI